jgi:hypothetical protein
MCFNRDTFFTRELNMTRLVTCLSCLVLSGCGGAAPPNSVSDAEGASSPTSANDAEARSNAPPANDNTRLDDPKKKPGPPEKVAFLAPPELQAQFSYVSFAWTNGPVNWDYMPRKERSQALLGFDGGFTRIQYDGDTVRIKEVYYDPKNIKNRWQEELRNAQWVRHGPEVFYHQDGRFEILFRIDGEVEGPCIDFDANGQETSRQLYKGGIPVE